MKKQSSIKAFVDRIEGDVAVIVLHDDNDVKFDLPIAYLPEGTSGGDHLQIAFALDRKSREDQRKRIEQLLRES